MRQRFIQFAIWLVVLISAHLLVNLAYQIFSVPYLDPETGDRIGVVPRQIPNLAATVLIFGIAGLLIGKSMLGSTLSVAAAMALGIVSVAFEVSTSYPWYQLFMLRADAPIYAHERWLAFAGVLTAPFSAAIGAFVLTRISRGAID